MVAQPSLRLRQANVLVMVPKIGIDVKVFEIVATIHDAIKFYERMGLKPFTVMYRGKIR